MRKSVRMTKGEVIELGSGLVSLAGLKGTDFNFKLISTQKNLVKAIAGVNKLKLEIDNDPGIKGYESARHELCMDLCVKDENGKPALIEQGENKAFDIPRTDENDGKFKALFDEYSEVIELNDDMKIKYTSMLKEEVEVELHLIKKSILPDDLTGVQLELLSPLLEED